MAASDNFTPSNTSTNPTPSKDPNTSTPPTAPAPPQDYSNLLLLLGLLAAQTTFTKNGSTTIHPSVPNPLFTPPSSPTTTIHIDASTRIMGHFNTVQMSSTPLSSSGSEGGIGNVLATALSNLAQPVAPLPRGDSWGGLPSPVPFASPKFDIKVQTGVSVCGSRNLVVLGADGKQVGLKRKAAVDLEDAPATKRFVKKEN